MCCVSRQIWDFPGQIDFFDPAFDSEHIFGGCGALIFVIDAQVYVHPISCLADLLYMYNYYNTDECRPFRMTIVKHLFDSIKQ